MDRPLWQIPIFLLGVAAHRAAFGFALLASHMGPAVATAWALALVFRHEFGASPDRGELS